MEGVSLFTELCATVKKMETTRNIEWTNDVQIHIKLEKFELLHMTAKVALCNHSRPDQN
jgi:hypothetical protein